MNEREQELIAGLADGSLDSDERAEAEELLRRRPELGRELEMQRAAIAALTTAPPPGLSMAEAAELQRGVASALGLKPKEAPARRPLPWLGLATAAVVVVALLAIGPLIALLSTGDDGDTAAQATTTLAETEARAQQAPADTVSPPVTEALPETVEADEGATAAEEAPQTSVAAATEEPAEGELFAAVPSLPSDLGEIENDDLTRLATELADIAGAPTVPGLRSPTEEESRLLAALTTVPEAPSAEDAPLDDAIDCGAIYLEQRQGTVTLAPLATASLDGVRLLLAVVEGDGTRTLVALQLEDCTEVAAVAIE